MGENKQDDRTFLRVIDANLNRAGEAARVIEDYARFVLDHAGLANHAKNLRHRMHVAAAEMGVETSALLRARDTAGDVGTGLSTETERKRSDVQALLRANFQRLEQALRVIEEYAKLLPAGGAEYERLRYDVYVLEKQFDAPPERPAALEGRPLMVLVGGGTPEETIALTEQVLEGGCRFIQLREKTLADGVCLDLARALRALTSAADAVLVVNDRVDVAKASSADGVHLGLDDMPIEDARRILGPSKLVGLTAHSIAELDDAEARGADYIGIGTMFPSPTKPDLDVKGPAELIPAAAKCPVPTYAIGGITRDNIDEVLALAAEGTVPILRPRSARSVNGTVPRVGITVASSITSSDDVAAETGWFVGRLTK